MEQPCAGKRHDDAVLVCSHDDMVIPDRAARLDDILHARLTRALNVVAEGEEGVGAAGDAGEGCDPGALLLRRQGFGLYGEGALLDAVRQHVLVFVG